MDLGKVADTPYMDNGPEPSQMCPDICYKYLPREEPLPFFAVPWLLLEEEEYGLWSSFGIGLDDRGYAVVSTPEPGTACNYDAAALEAQVWAQQHGISTIYVRRLP